MDQIVENLQAHQITLMKDVANLDQMYDLNTKYYKELTMYILAGEKRLAQIQAETWPSCSAKQAQASGTQADAQAYNDLVNLCNRFEKKLHDLELTRMVSVQMGPQTRLLQNNDTQMVEKIQSSLVNTIPLWKSQMVLALGLEHSRQATAAQSAVTEMTNNLLAAERGPAEIGHHRNRSGGRALHRGPGNPPPHQPAAHGFPGRGAAHPDRGRPKTAGGRGGVGPHRGRAEAKARWPCAPEPYPLSSRKIPALEHIRLGGSYEIFPKTSVAVLLTLLVIALCWSLATPGRPQHPPRTSPMPPPSRPARAD